MTSGEKLKTDLLIFDAETVAATNDVPRSARIESSFDGLSKPSKSKRREKLAPKTLIVEDAAEFYATMSISSK